MRLEALLLRRRSFFAILDFLVCLTCFLLAVMVWDFRDFYRAPWMIWTRCVAFLLLGALLTGSLFAVRKLDAEVFAEMMRHR